MPNAMSRSHASADFQDDDIMWCLAPASVALTLGTIVMSGTLYGAVGSGLLAHGGGDVYIGSGDSAIRNGALGSAVVGLPVYTAMIATVQALKTPRLARIGNHCWLATMPALSAAGATFSATGSAILRSAGHQEVLAVGPSAATGALGAAFIGFFLSLIVLGKSSFADEDNDDIELVP